MTNTITVGGGDSQRSYFPPKYPEEVQMITDNQKRQLIAVIYQCVIDENDRELKLMEVESLTFHEADYALYQFSVGKWS